MRRSTIIVIGLLITSFMLTPTKSSKTDDFFDQWRPYSQTDLGCHSDNLPNIQVPGSIIFNTTTTSVNGGAKFDISAQVLDFGGDFFGSTKDVSIGYNILDGDNGKFLSQSTSETSHLIDDNGNSTTVFTAEFTAPLTGGNYTIISYAISGSTSFFHWVSGQIRIDVTASGPIPPVVSIEVSDIVADKVNFTFDIIEDNGIDTIEMSIKGASQNITLDDNGVYTLDVHAFALGIHLITFNVTDLDGFSVIKIISIEIIEKTSSTTTETTTSSTTNSTIVPTTGNGKDGGILGNLFSVILLALLFFGVFWTPVLLGRRK